MGYKVTAVTGTNEGSLYDAIQKVNEGIYSSIEFDSSLDGQTIQFPAGVSIEKPVTISGNVILAGPAILSSADVTLEPAGFALSVQEQEEEAVYGIQVLKKSDSDVISSNLKLSSFNGSIVISGGYSEDDMNNSNTALKAGTIISDYWSVKGSSSIQMDGFHGSVKMDQGLALYSGSTGSNMDFGAGDSRITLGDFTGTIEIGTPLSYDQENDEWSGGGASKGIYAIGNTAAISVKELSGEIILYASEYKNGVCAIQARGYSEETVETGSSISLNKFSGSITISGGISGVSEGEFDGNAAFYSKASSEGAYGDSEDEWDRKAVKSSVSIKEFTGKIRQDKGIAIYSQGTESTISLGDFSGDIEVGTQPYYDQWGEPQGGDGAGIIWGKGESSQITIGEFSGNMTLRARKDNDGWSEAAVIKSGIYYCDGSSSKSSIVLKKFSGTVTVTGGGNGGMEGRYFGSSAFYSYGYISEISMEEFTGTIKMDSGVAIYSGSSSESSQTTSTVSLGDYSGNIEIGTPLSYDQENDKWSGGGAFGGIIAYGGKNTSITIGDFTGAISLIGSTDGERGLNAIYSRASYPESEDNISTVSIGAFKGNIRMSGGSNSACGIESSATGILSSVGIKEFAGTMTLEKGSGIISNSYGNSTISVGGFSGEIEIGTIPVYDDVNHEGWFGGGARNGVYSRGSSTSTISLGDFSGKITLHGGKESESGSSAIKSYVSGDGNATSAIVLGKYTGTINITNGYEGYMDEYEGYSGNAAIYSRAHSYGEGYDKEGNLYYFRGTSNITMTELAGTITLEKGIGIYSYGRTESTISIGNFSGSLETGTALSTDEWGELSGGDSYAGIYVSGQDSRLLMDSLSGKITVRGNPDEAAAAIQVQAIADNNQDLPLSGMIGGTQGGALNISGTVSVAAETAFAILGNVKKHLTVSGTITAENYAGSETNDSTGYAIFDGTYSKNWSYDPNTGGHYEKELITASSDDIIAIDANAEINGHIALGGGVNELSIDSSAQVKGNLNADSLNLIFRLNGKTSGNSALNITESGVFSGENQISCSITCDNAESGRYILISGAELNFSKTAFQITRGGENRSVTVNGESVVFSNGDTVALKQDGNTLFADTEIKIPDPIDPVDPVDPNRPELPEYPVAPEAPTMGGISERYKKYNVTIKWDKAATAGKTIKIANYEIQFDNNAPIFSKKTSFTIKNLDFGTHYYAVRAIDTNGNASAWSELKSFTVVDETAPTAKISKISIDGYNLTVNWNSGDKKGSVQSHELRLKAQNGAEIVRTFDGAAQSATFTLGEEYVGKLNLELTANDGVNSSKVAKKSIKIKDATPPSKVGNLVAPEADARYQAVLSWDPAMDNSGKIGKYVVEIDGKEKKTSKNFLKVSKLTVGSHSYRVYAIDKDKNAGEWSEFRTFEVKDVTAPKNVSVQAKVEGNSVALSWKQPKDNVGVVGYELRYGQNLETKLTFDSSVTSYNVQNLSAGNYLFQVLAFDAAGNYSDPKIKKATVKELALAVGTESRGMLAAV
ncbi:MAG: fibronectin type III domain-containing protein [Victivallales bacterium]